jgi:hypothetical protein
VNQTISHVRNSSPIRDLTTNKLASSLSERSDSTLPNAVNQTTSNVHCSMHTRDSTTTKFASSLSEKSDLTLPNAVNQTTSNVRCSSLTYDSTTNNFALSLSEPSDSTPASALNQTTSDTRNSSPTRDLKTTSRDPLDRKKLNPVQDNRVNFESGPTAGVSKSTIGFSRNISSSISISMFSLSYSTLPVSSESRSIISENPFPEHKTKMPPSPFPKGATSANYPKRNNHHVVTTVTNSSNEIISCQTTPSVFNTYPLSPQIAASDKSREKTTKISLESPLAPITPTYSPIPRLVTVTTSSVTTPNAHSPPRIITKRARFGRIIGGSPTSQSTTKLRIVLDDSASGNTGIPFSNTSWAEVFQDTSWAEEFHDTS